MRNWNEFFSMGGYAFFVWGSYLITLIAIAVEIFFLRRRKRDLERAGFNVPRAESNEETS